MRETPDAALAFERYYDLNEDRTLALLAHSMHQDILLKNNQHPTKRIPAESTILAQLKKWSVEHSWQNRVIERNRIQIEKERAKRDKAISLMNDRHALIGTTQQAKALKQIEALIEAKAFGSVAVVQLLKLSLEVERLARGAPTERQELTGKDGGPVQLESVVVYRLPDNGRDRIEEVKEEEGGDA